MQTDRLEGVSPKLALPDEAAAQGARRLLLAIDQVIRMGNADRLRLTISSE